MQTRTPAASKAVFAALIVFCAPVFIGILGVILPAAGFFPALGRTSLSLAPMAAFVTQPGLATSLWISLSTGLTATLLSLICGFCLLAWCAGTRRNRVLIWMTAPLIAVPHSAVAVGILFLLAPSGLVIRLISPELTGFLRPPTWGLVPDPHGWALVVALMVKEIPFICLVAVAAAGVMPVSRLEKIGASLGYGRTASWFMIIMPMIYARIRLPLAAVLVFALSVVDVPLIVGPGLPPPVSVLILHGFTDAELAARLPASAGAVIQIVLAITGLLVWRCGEILAGRILTSIRNNGTRLPACTWITFMGAGCGVLSIITGATGLVTAALWSLADRWRFPESLPTQVTMRFWQKSEITGPLLANSITVATVASAFAVTLVLAILALGPRPQSGKAITQPWVLPIVFAPLMVPQISFLFGLQIALSWARLDGTWLALIWAHALFILPYCWLVLAPAYTALDPRLDAVGASLGLSRAARFWRIALPMMGHPVGMALFVGIAVSSALYLPTLFAGAGRIATLTTEMVTLASGGNRSLTGVASMLLIAVPVLGFILIRLALHWRFGKFAGMHSGRLP